MSSLLPRPSVDRFYWWMMKRLCQGPMATKRNEGGLRPATSIWTQGRHKRSQLGTIGGKLVERRCGQELLVAESHAITHDTCQIHSGVVKTCSRSSDGHHQPGSLHVSIHRLLYGRMERLELEEPEYAVKRASDPNALSCAA